MHVHLLPGVDDGARSLDETSRMLERARSCGVTAIVATPHLRPSTDEARVRSAYTEVCLLSKEHGIAVHLGFEVSYMRLVPGASDLMDTQCLAGSRCFLLELHDDTLMPRWEAFLCDFVQRNYHPIIAHPERYTYIQRDPAIASEMRSYGCELQLDAGNLFAGIWSPAQRTARRLLDTGQAAYIASDAHAPADYGMLHKAVAKYGSVWPKEGHLNEWLANRGPSNG